MRNHGRQVLPRLAVVTALLFPTGSLLFGVENGDSATLRVRDGRLGPIDASGAGAGKAASMENPLALWFTASSGATPGTSDLYVSVQSNGLSSVVVLPGSVVNYEVVGILSNDSNEGLALVGFDLDFDGGDLSPADSPTGVPTEDCDDPINYPSPCCDNPMINFTQPWGVTNPAGFGGTVINGDLIQIGGAQNTINNTPDQAPFPMGPVLTGVAQPSVCGFAVLVTGSLSAPQVVGIYTLQLENLFANVIQEGETDDGTSWATEAAGVGEISSLTIEVAATGACCGMSGGCNEETPANCSAKAGFFAGPGVTCSGDDDLDHVVNACDRCPATPPGTVVGVNGCHRLPSGNRLRNAK